MIGIFGGTFDPVHFGHLRSASEVRERLQLDQIRLIPSRIPPHRQTPGASPALRLEFLKLALQDQALDFEIDSRELSREGPSFMVDTLASIRTEVPDTPLVLILGMDAFLGLPTWSRWLSLPQLAHIAFMRRPGAAFTPSEDLSAVLEERLIKHPKALQEAPCGRFIEVAVTPIDIASSEIRSRIEKGQSIDTLTPAPVIEAIYRNGLYVKEPKA